MADTPPQETAKISVAAEKTSSFSVGTIIKILAVVIAVALAFSIYEGFKNSKASQAFNNVADAFNSATAAAAWCAGHWYLILGYFALLPFLTAGQKWAAKALGKAEKSKLSENGKEAVSDAIVYTSKSQDASVEKDPVQRAKEEQQAQDAADRFNAKDEKAKEEARKYIEESGDKIKVP